MCDDAEGGARYVVDVGSTYTTICFLDRSLFVMNFRVRMVTGWSALDGVAMIVRFATVVRRNECSGFRRVSQRSH